MTRFEFGELAGLGCQGVELTALEAQEFQFAQAATIAFREARGLALQVKDAAVRGGVAFGLRGQATVRVDRSQLLGRLGQAAGAVLGMDLDQLAGRGAQRGDRHRGVVDPRLTAAVVADAPAQDEAAVAGSDAAGLLHQGGARRFDREISSDFAGLATRPDQFSRSAATRDEIKGVEQQGLAGPGLAGDRGQAFARRQGGAFDDDEVGDEEFAEHDGSTPMRGIGVDRGNRLAGASPDRPAFRGRRGREPVPERQELVPERPGPVPEQREPGRGPRPWLSRRLQLGLRPWQRQRLRHPQRP